MALPLATTTIAVLRVTAASGYDEPYGGDEPSTGREVAASGIQAVIGRPAGREQLAGSEQSITDLQLIADTLALQPTDWVRDETTGVEYRVVWAVSYPDPMGGTFTEAGIRRVEGEI